MSAEALPEAMQAAPGVAWPTRWGPDDFRWVARQVVGPVEPEPACALRYLADLAHDLTPAASQPTRCPHCGGEL